ncbi:MAG: DUF2268 domain-containing protein [Anaerolineae bacterium]|nr:DUF2268 domain-containing protein [Anaerolineae bacterium]
MNSITILDIESIYRRLFDAPDAQTRADLFEREIVAPFASLSQMFGGAPAFRQRGMWPEQFNRADNPAFAANFALMAQHNAWAEAANGAHEAYDAFGRSADLSAVGDITVALLLTANTVGDADTGYAGFGAIPGAVMVTYSQPNAENLRCVRAAAAHEMHHQLVGWLFGQGYMIQDLAHYMVAEGLAESFAAELYGADKVGPWVTRVDPASLTDTKRRFTENLGLSDFMAVRQFIFGDSVMAGFGGAPIGIPAYAGYALGYHTVQAYLHKTGQSVVEATFVPPHQLIAESGYLLS